MITDFWGMFWEEVFQRVLELVPDVENYSWATNIYWTDAVTPPGLMQPPVRIKMVLQRYLDYPEFYSGFATRSLSWMSVEDPERIGMEQENEALLSAIDFLLVPVILTDAFPLPYFENLDSMDFADARYTFVLQLDYNVSLFPANPSPAFVVYYWICGLIVSRLIRCYYADQISRVLRRLPD